MRKADPVQSDAQNKCTNIKAGRFYEKSRMMVRKEAEILAERNVHN